MPVIASLTTFTASTKAKAAEVNANFSAIRTTVNTYGLFTDVAATITAVYTYSGVPVFSNGVTVSSGGATITAGGVTIAAGGLTVTAGGATIGGNATVSGTLGVTGLTSVSTLTSSGLVTAATLSTVGLATLASASVTGAATVGGLLTASAGLTVTGTATATTFSGSGASLTNLPAANLTGTIAAISGVNLTNLNATNLASGTVAQARLPTSPNFSGSVTGDTVYATNGFAKNSDPRNPKFLGDYALASLFNLEPGGVGTSGCVVTTAPTGGTSQWLRVQTSAGNVLIPLITP